MRGGLTGLAAGVLMCAPAAPALAQAQEPDGKPVAVWTDEGCWGSIAPRARG